MKNIGCDKRTNNLVSFTLLLLGETQETAEADSRAIYQGGRRYKDFRLPLSPSHRHRAAKSNSAVENSYYHHQENERGAGKGQSHSPFTNLHKTLMQDRTRETEHACCSGTCWVGENLPVCPLDKRPI